MQTIEIVLLFGATLLTVRAFLEYYIATAASAIAPNRWSWLIWTATTGIEVLTFNSVSENLVTTAVFAASFVACVMVTILIWGRSVWSRPSNTEMACLAASALALMIWLGFGSAWWAHLVMLVAVPLSFLPTYLSAWQDYRREAISSWMWWTLSDLCALVYVVSRFESAKELPYAAVEAACHGAVWFIVRARLKDRERQNAALGDAARITLATARVSVGANHLGKAVFASRAFEPGALITRFGGDPIRGGDVPKNYLGAADRFMQIDHDIFLGPSGRVDDFVNHSCDPNAGISFTGRGIFLIALRPIAKGEEISWDYSTTMHKNDWLMRCECRTSACRGFVGEFLGLPEERRAQYLAAGVVAPYIVQWLEQPLAHDEIVAAQDAQQGAEGAPSLLELNARIEAFASEQAQREHLRPPHPEREPAPRRRDAKKA